MNETEKRRVLMRALKLFGLRDPLSQLIEASAELIIAVQHVQQKRDGYIDALAEQVADVELLLEQLRLTASALSDRVDGLKILKLERLKNTVYVGHA